MSFNKFENIEDSTQKEFLKNFKEVNLLISHNFKKQFNRTLPIGDLHSDRWEKSKNLNFGEGSNIYDSSYVFGDVEVGRNCWIGMFTVIDGSGGLKIGNNCTISAGVHIYSHDNVKATLLPQHYKIAQSPVSIGNNVYIGPHSIISKGVTLGNCSVVAANSFVNKSFPDNAIIAGNPGKKIGEVVINNNEVSYKYYNH